MSELHSQPCPPSQAAGENPRGEVLDAASDDVAALRCQIAYLQTELGSALNQLAASQAAVAKLSGDVSELAESLRTARTQLDSVFRSRSWRWLEPIRKANFLLKSYRKKLRAAQLPR